MKNYIIKMVATIGKSKAEGDLHNTVQLFPHAVVEAENEEAARAQFTGYREPGFKLEIESVAELGDTVKSEELVELMPLTKVVTEIKI